MRAEVINYGKPQYFPTCLGNIWLERGRMREIENPQAIKELSAFPIVHVKIVSGATPSIDYSKYPISQLRHIASQAGIKGTFKMKKTTLIQILSEEK